VTGFTKLIALSALALTTACASGTSTRSSDEQLLDQARGPEETKRLHTDLIREMVSKDRLYAAMAHLEAQEKKFGRTPELRLLRAEILRKLERLEPSEKLYKSLLETGFEGRAQHGLGLIYARQDIDLGIEYLRKAVQARPTDARIRNDLGYALLKARRFEDARLHLATAYQLDGKSDLGRNNYLLLLLIQGEEGQANRVARESDIGPETMNELRQQAKAMRQARAATRARIEIGGGGG